VLTVIPKPNKRNTIPEDFGIEPEYEICYIRTSDIKKLFSSSGEGGDIGLDRRNRLEPSSEVL